MIHCWVSKSVDWMLYCWQFFPTLCYLYYQILNIETKLHVIICRKNIFNRQIQLLFQYLSLMSRRRRYTSMLYSLSIIHTIPLLPIVISLNGLWAPMFFLPCPYIYVCVFFYWDWTYIFDLILLLAISLLGKYSFQEIVLEVGCSISLPLCSKTCMHLKIIIMLVTRSFSVFFFFNIDIIHFDFNRL